MIDHSALRALAREAMQAGTLPDRPADQMWGGPGTDAACAVCGKAIGCDETEFELQYGDPADHVKVLHTHVGCFVAWDVERQDEGGKDPPLIRAGKHGIILTRGGYAKNGGKRQ